MESPEEWKPKTQNPPPKPKPNSNPNPNQVPRGRSPSDVMLEAVTNHGPDVVLIDEIGTPADAHAARQVAMRGVVLVATAHGAVLSDLMRNPDLVRLVGGIQPVTTGDKVAHAAAGGRKTRLERAGSAAFQVLIELQAVARLRVHLSVDASVDRLLRGGEADAHVRSWAAGGVAAAARRLLAPGGGGAGGGEGEGGEGGGGAGGLRLVVTFETEGAEAQAQALSREADRAVRAAAEQEKGRRRMSGGGTGGGGRAGKRRRAAAEGEGDGGEGSMPPLQRQRQQSV
jgi:hypothetical protein